LEHEEDDAKFQPRLVLRLGVTGHRPPRLDVAQQDLVKEQCCAIFQLAQESLQAIREAGVAAYGAETPEVHLVSALAEGADVWAGEAALECGAALAACLPFSREQYRHDFAPEEWRRSEALLNRARSVATLAEYKTGDETAYELAGRMVLSQSDILIAIWDGEAARGRGGTTHIIADAVALHQPVIHIDAAGKQPPQILWSGLHEAVPDRPSLDGVERANAAEILPQVIAALCAPPIDRQHTLARFYAPGGIKPRRFLGWPVLLAASGARPWRSLLRKSPTLEESAQDEWRHLVAFRIHGAFGQKLETLLLPRYSRADYRANSFAVRFRSSFVANFMLAGLAVLFALSGLLLPQIKLWLIAAELVVIVIIVINTRRTQRGDYHHQWLDHRHMAERLRLLALSSALGRLSLRDVENGTRRPGWVSWYVRATARELGLVRADFDNAYLAKVQAAMLKLIDEQAAYHRRNARAMSKANHRLHLIGDNLFFGTIIACLLFLGISFFAREQHALSQWNLPAIVTFVTAAFPALAAALYGIRMQGDFAATSERSSIIARQLIQLKFAVVRDPLSFERLTERSRRLSEIMLAESDQWRLHYETRPLSLPG
jgi:hypothetical protein